MTHEVHRQQPVAGPPTGHREVMRVTVAGDKVGAHTREIADDRPELGDGGSEWVADILQQMAQQRRQQLRSEIRMRIGSRARSASAHQFKLSGTGRRS